MAGYRRPVSLRAALPGAFAVQWTMVSPVGALACGRRLITRAIPRLIAT
jgi:hypothetical protein